jgi:hypothetical protein
MSLDAQSQFQYPEQLLYILAEGSGSNSLVKVAGGY